MTRLIPTLAACAAFSCASAQTIYKCTVDGKPAYGDRPCTAGAVTELAMPPAPAPDPETAARLARQRVMAMHPSERELREERAAERELQRVRRAAASQRIKCDRLRLRHQWTQEDVRRAGSRASTAILTKARRQAELIALECAS